MENYQMDTSSCNNITEMFKLKNFIKDAILLKLFQAVNQTYESQINIISEKNDPSSMGFIFRGERFRRTNLEIPNAKDFIQLNKELYVKADRIISAHKIVLNDSKNIENMINVLFIHKLNIKEIISALPPELYDLIKECLDEEYKMYNPSLFIEKKIYLTYKPVIQRYLGTLLLCQ